MGEGPSYLDLALVGLHGQTGCTYIAWASGPSGLHAPVKKRGKYARRVDRLRAVTYSGRIRDEERATADELADLKIERRPKTYADCIEAQRPCPWVSCKHHLYIEVNPVTGSVRLPFGDLEIDQIPHTCAIDAALEGPLTLDGVGEFMNLTKERARQLETKAMAQIPARIAAMWLKSPSMVSREVKRDLDF